MLIDVALGFGKVNCSLLVLFSRSRLQLFNELVSIWVKPVSRRFAWISANLAAQSGIKFKISDLRTLMLKRIRRNRLKLTDNAFRKYKRLETSEKKHTEILSFVSLCTYTERCYFCSGF